MFGHAFSTHHGRLVLVDHHFFSFRNYNHRCKKQNTEFNTGQHPGGGDRGRGWGGVTWGWGGRGHSREERRERKVGRGERGERGETVLTG